MMVKAALKKNIQREAPELKIGDTVRILNNALVQIQKYGKMKVTSLKKMQNYLIILRKYIQVLKRNNSLGLGNKSLMVTQTDGFHLPF